MLACIDVDYRPHPSGREQGVAACVEFEHWTDPRPFAEHVVIVPEVAPYVSGQFYTRELPCTLALLAELALPPELIVIDGYVQLDDQGRDGFGMHLWRALDERTPIVGVAKHPFHANPAALELLRGTSRQPLFVTAIGIDVGEALERVRSMHGEYRLPTLLKRVDRLCRGG